MSDKPKQRTFLAKEVEFSGQYSREVFQTLFEGYRPFWRRCAGATALGFLGRALLLSNANWIGYWVDSFCRAPQTCRPTPSFLSGFDNSDYLVLLTSVTLIGFLLTVIFRLVFSRLSAQAVSRIYDEVTLRTSRLPMTFFDTTPAGRIITRFSSDYGNVFRLFGGPLAELISIVSELICTVVLIAVASFYFLPILAVTAMLNYLVYRANRASLRKERRELSASRSPSIAHFAETVQGASTIRAYLRQSTFIQRFERLNDQFLNQKLRTTWIITGFSFQMSSLTALMLLATGVTGYMLNASGRISVGAVGVAFGLITLSGSTLQMFFEWLAQFEEAMVGMERLDNYLRKTLEPGSLLPASAEFITDHSRYQPAHEVQLAESRLFAKPNAVVRFEHVWFRYAPDLPYVLKDIDFEVRAGEKLGVIGRTGSGKSSLIQALFHLYPLARGHVRIDGLRPHTQTEAPIESDEVDLSLFRRALGLIAQEPVLFQGTVRENLSLEPLANETLLSALNRVGLDQWIQEMPGGLDGRIEERGRNISLGERQLLCMARCLLQQAPVIVMDEATSSVDPQSEELLVRATQAFFADRTQIIVAHRLSTLKGCDRILWLQNGEIQMLGRPDEVLPVFQKTALTSPSPS